MRSKKLSKKLNKYKILKKLLSNNQQKTIKKISARTREKLQKKYPQQKNKNNQPQKVLNAKIINKKKIVEPKRHNLDPKLEVNNNGKSSRLMLTQKTPNNNKLRPNQLKNLYKMMKPVVIN